ncbi:MAG TPA: FHA domain-containing protein [Mycobacterium sp.]
MRDQTFAPPLTVQVGSAVYTFAPGSDVIVGRSPESDVLLDGLGDERVSRQHLVLRFDGTHWVAIDRSRNGTYVDGTRVSAVTIHDGQTVNFVDPCDGPRVFFRIGTRPHAATTATNGSAPTRLVRRSAPRSVARGRQADPAQVSDELPVEAAQPQQPIHPPISPFASPVVERAEHPPTDADAPTATGFRAQPEHVEIRPLSPRNVPEPESLPHASQGAAPDEPTVAAPSARAEPRKQQNPAKRSAGTVRGWLRRRQKSAAIGRSKSCDITVDDVLVSRVHAKLRASDTGLEIKDNAGGSGTFVNGDRISRRLLADGDIVTVGNTDYAVTGTALLPRPDADGRGIEACRLALSVDGNSVLTDASFRAPHGTLTAVIGPPGASKSALLKLLAGGTRPSSGDVSCDGHDMQREYASIRSRIATVPRDDVMHDRLTVEQILCYAADLRLPSDTSTAERRHLLNRVIDMLELTPHRKVRAEELSSGGRRRVTVAVEVLTRPSVVIFDERSTEPDQSPVQHTMMIARRLADAGHVVVVAMHSLALLSLCDQVLLFSSDGRVAFAGPPAEIKAAVADTRWSETFARGSLEPGDTEGSPSAQPARLCGVEPLLPIDSRELRHISVWRQVSTVARRQARLIFANRRYFLFLASLPFIFGGLALAVPGHVGLGGAGPGESSTGQPPEILVLLSLGAVFCGTALTFREIFAEQRIFRRERSIGLSAAAYLAAKVVVFGFFATLQVAVMTSIALIGEAWTVHGGLMSSTAVELFSTLLTTAIVSATIGLAVSALAEQQWDAVLMFILVVFVSMAFAGGFFSAR